MQVVPIRSRKPIVQGRRARVKALNRQIILDAARRVFAEMGYGATRVRDIIRATPLAAGTFYNYFQSKEEVFQALCEEAAQLLAPVTRDARHRAKSAEAFFLATFSPFFTLIAERRDCGADLEPLHKQPSVLALGELKQDIELAVARGVLPPVNPHVLASAMWGLASGLVETLPNWCSPQEAAQAATGFMLGGFQALVRESKPVAVNY